MSVIIVGFLNGKPVADWVERVKKHCISTPALSHQEPYNNMNINNTNISNNNNNNNNNMNSQTTGEQKSIAENSGK